MARSPRPSLDDCRFILHIFLFIICLLSLPPYSTAATQVTLTWDANSEPNLAGYHLYARQAGEAYNYSLPACVCSDTSCTIYDLVDTVDYCFVVRAYGANGIESPDSKESCTTDDFANVPPIADAGPDQNSEAGIFVILNGSNSTDLDSGIVSFLWEQVKGPPVELMFDPLKPYAIFIAPEVGSAGESLTFELTITDNGGLQGSDKCTVFVNDESHMDRWKWEWFLYDPRWNLLGGEH